MSERHEIIETAKFVAGNYGHDLGGFQLNTASGVYSAQCSACGRLALVEPDGPYWVYAGGATRAICKAYRTKVRGEQPIRRIQGVRVVREAPLPPAPEPAPMPPAHLVFDRGATSSNPARHVYLPPAGHIALSVLHNVVR